MAVNQSINTEDTRPRSLVPSSLKRALRPCREPCWLCLAHLEGPPAFASAGWGSHAISPQSTFS